MFILPEARLTATSNLEGEMRIVFATIPFGGKQSLAELKQMAEKAAKESFNFDQVVEIVLEDNVPASSDIKLQVEHPPDVPLNWSKGKKVTSLMQAQYLESVFTDFISKFVTSMHRKWFGQLKISSIQASLPNNEGSGYIRLMYGGNKTK